MTRSSARTAARTLSADGSATSLSRPQPRASPASASPTAAVGNRKRRTRVSTTTTPRLLGQRVRGPIACPGRGASSSQSAIRARTPRKPPSRIAGSAARKDGCCDTLAFSRQGATRPPPPPGEDGPERRSRVSAPSPPPARLLEYLPRPVGCEGVDLERLRRLQQ